MRPTLCQVDLSAIATNVAALQKRAGVPLCAVVKANGYGHGAVPVARAALEAGAAWLAVALVEEGIELRQAGIDAPILLLSEPTIASLSQVLEFRLTPTVYRIATVTALAEAALSSGPIAVHVGVDSGMRRVGVELSELADVLAAVDAHESLRLEAIWTHFPVADEPDNPFTARQLTAFGSAVEATGAVAGTHVANSASAILHADPDAFMVRCGICLLYTSPSPRDRG